ncbi:spondin-1 isoform X2 [Anastrepha ludens]|uniref:spondin-1 isoform X2 n=1 Tax=Anastrepha ludens TaxID=28586 RepID=UPI0023B13AEB|nr:spondin-1 isoform X2 [Anastrepha ludens]
MACNPINTHYRTTIQQPSINRKSLVSKTKPVTSQLRTVWSNKMNWLALIISISATINIALACSRIPPGATTAKSRVDDNYMVSIAGNPQTYIPGQKYNVSLVAYNDLSFISFILALESANEVDEQADFGTLGYFEIIDLTETRFSPRCPNLVENTNTNMKTHVEVIWVAPATTGNGCVLIKATVTQHRDVWFMDDGFLTKRICEEEVDDVDTQPSIVDPCCACDEAKYELTFEGKWSRHTHPKDFPANSWRTRFSDIIGASHTIDYRFWTYGELGSQGLREVAEHGSTRTLESELKDQSDQIRTIIKARGISYPNVTGKTFAVFRVDSKHHLISLVSMIDPSPDWIVGISALELCLPNCTWIENKVHNLYPWDAGTDNGPSYMSADQPQVPPDVIRRIKSNFPNDPRSPFYDPSGAPMKPLATLHINRRRLYEKTCENAEGKEPTECATFPWSHWSDCSPKCGSGTQHRTREYKQPAVARRSKCHNTLREEQPCNGQRCGPESEDNAEEDENTNEHEGNTQEVPECAISGWSGWSTCSATCGSGVIIRSRHYLNPRAKKKCQETRKCEGPECGGDLANGAGGEGGTEGDETAGEEENAVENELSDGTSAFHPDNNNGFRLFQSYSQKREDYIPPECGYSQWSDFSPCIGPCGSTGYRQRQRKIWNNDEVYGVKNPKSDGSDPCRHIKREEMVNCTNPACDTIVPHYCFASLKISPCRDGDVTNYWYYDYPTDQCAIFWADKCDKNHNKFLSKEACEDTCRRPRQKLDLQSESLRMEHQPVDCAVSEWEPRPCNVTCGEGMQIKTRRVLRRAKYGGKPCPKHLVRLEKCYQSCDEVYTISGGLGGSTGDGSDFDKPFRNRGSYVSARQMVKKDDCRYSEWSAWTPCTASCGDNSMRQKTRTLLNTELSYKCKDRVRVEKCIVMPCLLESNDQDSQW